MITSVATLHFKYSNGKMRVRKRLNNFFFFKFFSSIFFRRKKRTFRCKGIFEVISVNEESCRSLAAFNELQLSREFCGALIVWSYRLQIEIKIFGVKIELQLFLVKKKLFTIDRLVTYCPSGLRTLVKTLVFTVISNEKKLIRTGKNN